MICDMIADKNVQSFTYKIVDKYFKDKFKEQKSLSNWV